MERASLARLLKESPRPGEGPGNAGCDLRRPTVTSARKRVKGEKGY